MRRQIATGEDVLPGLEDRFPGRVHHADAGSWERILVLGDVHGYLRELDALLEEVGFGDDDLLICVGDIVNEGPNCAGTLRRVVQAKNIRSVQGDGEGKLLRGELELDGADGGSSTRWPAGPSSSRRTTTW